MRAIILVLSNAQYLVGFIILLNNLAPSNSSSLKFPRKLISSVHLHTLNTASSMQKSIMKIFDTNNDGILTADETKDYFLNHTPLLTTFLDSFKSLALQFLDNKKKKKVLLALGKILSPIDLLILSFIILTYKPLLKKCHKLLGFGKNKCEYEVSLFGYLEGPITFLVWYPFFLFFLDAGTIILDTLGYKHLIKSNFIEFIGTFSATFIVGSFLTKLKDWFGYRASVKLGLNPNRDILRESLINELTSLAIWAVLIVLVLQTQTIQIGVALGSIFAVGGIGSASFVLALRSTMENAVGGLLLRFQDKYRVGEKISIPGKIDEGDVENISYLTTRLRLNDDSIINIPNAIFIQGEVINWSRTPYRLFSTEINWQQKDISLLPDLITKLSEDLKTLPGVEFKERDLIVSAKGFKRERVIIEVEVRLIAGTDLEIAKLRTDVVNLIASIKKRFQELIGSDTEDLLKKMEKEEEEEEIERELEKSDGEKDFFAELFQENQEKDDDDDIEDLLR